MSTPWTSGTALVNALEERETPEVGGSTWRIIPGLVGHRGNGGTLGMVPTIINSIYTLYSGYLLGFIG